MPGGSGAARRGAVVLVVGLAGVLCAIALGAGDSARDTAPSLPTLSNPAPRPPGATIISTLSSTTTNAVVGLPFTVTVSVQDVNVSMSFTSLLTGFDNSALTIESATTDVGLCTMAAGQLQCPIGGLGPGDVGHATIVIVANAPASFAFTANSLSSSQGSLTVNVSPAAVPVATAALSIQAPSALLRPKVGRTARAGLQVRNGGPATDSTATLSLTVPRQVRLVAAAPLRGTCDVKTLTCQLGPLPAGGSDLVVLTFRAVEPGKANVLAQVSGDVADATTTNKQGTISVEIPKPPVKPKH